MWRVKFTPDDSVTIVADYGYSFTVTPDMEDDWVFTVWPDEGTAMKERQA